MSSDEGSPSSAAAPTARPTVACRNRKFPYDCDTDPGASDPMAHRCAAKALDCRGPSATGPTRNGPFCGEGAYRKFPIDCDYVPRSVESQLGYCTKENDRSPHGWCREVHGLVNQTGYRKRKPRGSNVGRQGKKKLADLLASWEAARNKNYPPEWTAADPQYDKVPGDRGFNAYAQQYMKAPYLAIDRPSCDGPRRLFPHQKVFTWMMHPCTPFKRMLAVHMTGAGKTAMIIGALNNYMYDPEPRAIVLVFPTKPVVDNFYKEILAHPDCTLRAWLEKAHPELIRRLKEGRKPAHGEPDPLTELRDVLAFTKKLTSLPYTGKRLSDGTWETNDGVPIGAGPRSPVRAFALNDFCNKIVRGDDPIFNWGRYKNPRDRARQTNPADAHTILIDEAHNLVAPSAEWQKTYPAAKKLPRVRELLRTATDSIVVGFTATPFGDASRPNEDASSDGMELLRTIKGRPTPTDEGFVSMYMRPMPNILCEARPDQSHMPARIDVDVRGGGVGAAAAAARQPKAAKSKKKTPHTESRVKTGTRSTRIRRLNIGKEPSYQSRWVHTIKKRPAPFDLDDPSLAPKLHAAVHHIRTKTAAHEKTLILASQDTGFFPLCLLLKHNGIKALGIFAGSSRTTAPAKTRQGDEARKLLRSQKKPIKGFNGVVMDDGVFQNNISYNEALEMFNEDVDASGAPARPPYRVVVLNMATAREGVSVFDVRHTLGLDVFDNWKDYRQGYGRGQRSCRQRPPGAPCTNDMAMMVTIDPTSDQPTLDEAAWNKAAGERDTIERRMCSLAAVAVDAPILAPYVGANPCPDDPPRAASPPRPSPTPHGSRTPPHHSPLTPHSRPVTPRHSPATPKTRLDPPIVDDETPEEDEEEVIRPGRQTRRRRVIDDDSDDDDV
jgi:hypothetical protein